MLIIVNRNLKHVCWDSIEGDQWWPLIARTIQGNATILINFTSVKFYTLTLVAIVNNFSPLFTTILAYFFLRENIANATYLALFVTFIGALVMIMGAKEEDPVAEGSSTFGFICLLLNPVLVGIGTCMMRKMKKLNESVVSCYMNSTSIIVMGPLVYAFGGDLSPWFSFTVWDWCWIIGLSFSVVGSQTFRYRAL